MLHVCCVKWGKLYGPEYVNTLFDMVRRNLPAGFPGRFVCLTDDPAGLEEGIQTLPLPQGIIGWWNKLYLFAPNVFPKGERVLFFDLDTAITGPLDEIASYAGPFAILRDAYRKDGLQSSVMAWEVGTHRFWEAWHRQGCPMDGRGDQGFIEDAIERGHVDLWQDLFPGKFRSYKVECRTQIPRGTSVVFFHGHPRPHEVETGWVPEVWKIGGGSGVEFIVQSNVRDDALREHVRSAIQRSCQWVRPGNDTRTAIIVGGGPSLAKHLFYIRGMQMAGGIVFATNNTYAYLKDHGIQPDAHVMLDARAENLAFVPTDTVPKFYASQCHPSVLDAAGNDLICWHAAHACYQPLLEGTDSYGIGGGTTVGMKALALAFTLGHRHFRLFGFDSSYAESHHAYPQALNDGEKTLQVKVGGRSFKAAPWMVTQMEEFKEFMPLLMAEGCVVRIFGDGLIPHVASLMVSHDDGLKWPEGDIEARPAILSTVQDLHEFMAHCDHKRVAVQAGGNVGVFAKELAKHFERVLTFEPDPANWECLVQNLSETNIEAFNAALGDAAGTVSIEHNSRNCGASRVSGDGNIPISPLDTLALDCCDLLQLDIEGYELKALKGAERTIRQHSPVIVLELKGHGERYGDSDESIISWLAERGYTRAGSIHRDVIFTRTAHESRAA